MIWLALIWATVSNTFLASLRPRVRVCSNVSASPKAVKCLLDVNEDSFHLQVLPTLEGDGVNRGGAVELQSGGESVGTGVGGTAQPRQPTRYVHSIWWGDTIRLSRYSFVNGYKTAFLLWNGLPFALRLMPQMHFIQTYFEPCWERSSSVVTLRGRRAI